MPSNNMSAQLAELLDEVRVLREQVNELIGDVDEGDVEAHGRLRRSRGVSSLLRKKDPRTNAYLIKDMPGRFVVKPLNLPQSALRQTDGVPE